MACMRQPNITLSAFVADWAARARPVARSIGGAPTASPAIFTLAAFSGPWPSSFVSVIARTVLRPRRPLQLANRNLQRLILNRGAALLAVVGCRSGRHVPRQTSHESRGNFTGTHLEFWPSPQAISPTTTLVDIHHELRPRVPTVLGGCMRLERRLLNVTLQFFSNRIEPGRLMVH